MAAERRTDMRTVAAWMVAVGVTLAGCGDSVEVPTAEPAATSPEPTASSAPMPATTLLLAPVTGGAPIGSLVPVEVTEPCPTSAPRSNDGTSDGSAMLAESGRLEPMLGRVLAYGARFPDEFGSYGLVWHASDDASVFVSFTGRLDVHRDELEATVEYPDELIVCQVAVAGEVARLLEAELVAELSGSFLSVGRGGPGVRVTLAANEEALAAELQARYGDAIELTVGALAYPIEDATSVCAEPPVGRELPGLSIEVVAPGGPIDAPGVESPDLTVLLTNTGANPIRFDSGTAVGTILDGDGHVVSAHVVGIADVGMSVDLPPGASTELPLVVSTVSCDPALGYALPAGEYQLVAAVDHLDGDVSTLLSDPVSIAVGR